ncbi:TPA: hypothetical protein ACT96X_001406 [Legionella pneumophila]|uniref:hypothetical protein n=1 Tax=Legionella pneumophila TaxID=446 RepID=UPI000AFD463E|nr:hypothetical protein [Legionella pneumophila]
MPFLIVTQGEAMYSKEEQRVKNDSGKDDVDNFISIEEHSSSDDGTDEPSLSEQVFTKLQIYSEGFKPSFFTDKDLAYLSLTSKTLNSVVFSELNQRKKAQKLVAHVVLGKQDEAQAMIEKNPELLLISSETVDYSGRTIIGTAFQAALGAGDKPMWEMMLPYFNGLEEGEALRQFNEQFPNGIEDDVSAEQLKDYYNAIALAIINDEDHGLSVIEGFRKDITSKKEITQGKHFNLQHLVAAYQAYIDNFNTLANWPNRDLFWQKVIGYVQRQMTAYDAQIHCSGVNRVLDNENSFARKLKFSNGGEFFPLQLDSGLGFTIACYSYHDSAGAEPHSGRAGAAWLPVLWMRVEKLCGAKTDALAGLRESLEQGMVYQPH